MSKQAIIALSPASAPTGTQTSTGIDISDITGNITVVLDCAQPAAGETLDVKLQHSDTLGGTYTDTGDAFTQVTNAGGASYQTLAVSGDKFKKFVRVVQTKVGTTALARGVYLVGSLAK